MTIKVKYRVHSAKREDVDTVADLGGRKVPAKVPGLVVELVRENAAGAWAHTYRFVPDDDEQMREALETFKPGAKVMVPFEPVAG